MTLAARAASPKAIIAIILLHRSARTRDLLPTILDRCCWLPVKADPLLESVAAAGGAQAIGVVPPVQAAMAPAAFSSFGTRAGP